MPIPPFNVILRPELGQLRAYVPHPGRFPVRLDANEAPPLLSPQARAVVDRAACSVDWCRYPDAQMTELREAIAARSNAAPDEVLAGCGSDEIISLVLTALGRPRDGASSATVLVVTPTFIMYRMAAAARGLGVIEVPLDPAWDLDVDAMKTAIEAARPHVVFVASPNNPTSGLMSLDRLEAVIAAARDSLVILDEAYLGYAGPAGAAQAGLRRYPNVVLLRTLSKAGFAALRVGWMIGPAALVAEIDKVRSPYNLNAASQAIATVVLRDLGPEIDRVTDVVVRERARVAAALVALGLSVATSAANFLWVETRRPAVEVFAALAARGVLVRSFGERHLRITVGLPTENDHLIEALSSIP